MKAKVPVHQLIERKVEKRQVLAQHAEEVKENSKKNLVFRFVKQAYIS